MFLAARGCTAGASRLGAIRMAAMCRLSRLRYRERFPYQASQAQGRPKRFDNNPQAVQRLAAAVSGGNHLHLFPDIVVKPVVRYIEPYKRFLFSWGACEQLLSLAPCQARHPPAGTSSAVSWKVDQVSVSGSNALHGGREKIAPGNFAGEAANDDSPAVQQEGGGVAVSRLGQVPYE